MAASPLSAVLTTLILGCLLTGAVAGEAAGERGELRERLRAKLLERFDANHDGKLEAAERQAAMAAWKQHAAELLAKHPKLDRNHDGPRPRDLEALRERSGHQRPEPSERTKRPL